MSNPPPPDRYGETTTDRTDEGGEGQFLEAIAPTLAAKIRVTGFWGTIVLPVAYVPVLATGLSTALDLGVFLALVGLNLLALYAGRAHRR